jgi:hypothetical protein
MNAADDPVTFDSAILNAARLVRQAEANAREQMFEDGNSKVTLAGYWILIAQTLKPA